MRIGWIQAGLAVAGLLILSGCATLSEDECRTADWRTIGYEDGMSGQLSRRIGQHREACAEVGIAPDLQAYLAGHKQGVKHFCRPQNGFNLGKRGAGYNGVCSGDAEYKFLRGYRSGKQVHQLYVKISALRRDIEQIHKEQHELEDEIASNEELIIADSTSPKLRKELLKQNRKLEQIIVEKAVYIRDYEHRIGRLEVQAERLVNNFRP